MSAMCPRCALCNLLLCPVAHPQFLAPLLLNLLNLAIVKGKGRPKGTLGSWRATGGELGKYSTLITMYLQC
jgi:hypothetical protein